jgi:hypothetical protein
MAASARHRLPDGAGGAPRARARHPPRLRLPERERGLRRGLRGGRRGLRGAARVGHRGHGCAGGHAHRCARGLHQQLHALLVRSAMSALWTGHAGMLCLPPSANAVNDESYTRIAVVSNPTAGRGLGYPMGGLIMLVCGNPPDMHALCAEGDKGMPLGVQPSCSGRRRGLPPQARNRVHVTCPMPDAPGCARPGNKSEAKALMSAAGVPVVPGYHGQDQSLPRSGVAAGWLCMQRATAHACGSSSSQRSRGALRVRPVQRS